MKLDAAWSKEQILEAYLNQVYYGNRAYGVEAAAQTYFSKSAADLTLADRIPVVLLVVALFAVGLYPNLLLNLLR